MAATVESRVDPGPLAGVRRASFGQCGMDFATTTMGTAAFRRLSNAADKAAEARNRLSAQFELGAISALPVKRLSEELAAVLKKRDSWSASVSPLPLSLSQPDVVKAHEESSPCEAPSCSPNCKASVTNGPVKEPATLQAHYQSQHHQPWYSLLTCRLLSFIGGGGPPLAQGGEEYTTATHAVVSSHRLSFDCRLSHEYRASLERRVSESFSIRSLSMDSGGSEFCFSRDSLSGRRIAPGRRRAHEFAREDTYERDTSFYSEMACAPVTRLSGLSSSSARKPSGEVDNIEAEEEEMDKMVFRRRRDAYKEAWRRSASQDTASLDGPAHVSAVASCALAVPPPLPMPPAAAALRPAMPRIDSTDFANDELMLRNEIFCGRL